MNEPILQFFEYHHLPLHLQDVSRPFFILAHSLVEGKYGSDGAMLEAPVPRNPERTVALRKLLEAKDCAIRAVIYKETL